MDAYRLAARLRSRVQVVQVLLLGRPAVKFRSSDPSENDWLSGGTESDGLFGKSGDDTLDGDAEWVWGRRPAWRRG